MSLRKRRAFRSVVVGSGGLTVVISPYPHPSPLPTGEGAKSVGSRAWLLAAVVCLSSFRRTLTPAPSRRARGPNDTAPAPARRHSPGRAPCSQHGLGHCPLLVLHGHSPGFLPH